jgi:hypothetical protein
MQESKKRSEFPCLNSTVQQYRFYVRLHRGVEFFVKSIAMTMMIAAVAQIVCIAVTLCHGQLTCLRGAFPPVDLRAVCLVRAIVNVVEWIQ